MPSYCANPKCKKTLEPSRSKNRKIIRKYCSDLCCSSHFKQKRRAAQKEKERIEANDILNVLSPGSFGVTEGMLAASRSCQEIGIRWSYGAGYKLKAGYDRYTLQCSS